MPSPDDIAVVVIGRNEGARLIACLDALAGQGARIVYVDSGSRDDSVAQARARGACVVTLDMDRPFTAARARNAGVDALQAQGAPGFVQFLDGDCVLQPGWLTAARDAMADDPGLGIVTGWRREKHPKATVYNAMCEVEWHRPAGPIDRCGGDMMVRMTAFRAAGGFDPRVIAAEDDEFCIRLRAKGWRMTRLALTMTVHDAAMTRFSQWWRRMQRAGHGFAQVDHLHPGYFRTELRRVLIYAAALPLLAVAGLILAPWLLGGVLAIYALSYLRTVHGLCRGEGLPLRAALHHGLFLSLSKLPNLIGVVRFHLRRLSGQDMRLIEYK